MTKEEIIKLLEEEVGLFTTEEDENDLGELYITGKQFREASDVIKQLKETVKNYNEWIKKLKKKITDNEEGIYIKGESGEMFKDKNIYFTKDVYFLDCGMMIFSHNVFAGENGLSFANAK